jgi:hypothetical protein
MGGMNLYFRDTMLLAPAASRSLNAIGKLYENENEKFKKRSLPEVYKTKISTWVQQDLKAFEEYALTDVLIVLKHSTEMETFNLSMKKIGVPITLSSMGKNFVFEQ